MKEKTVLKETIHWIDVADELPDSGSEVLVCFERNDCEDRDVTIAGYDDSRDGESPWEVAGGLMCFGTVMYWAEMPFGPIRSQLSEVDPSCPGCKFFVRDNMTPKGGACRRQSPVRSESGWTEFARVYDDHWCGEFQAKRNDIRN